MGEPSQRNIGCGTGEPFGAGELNRRHAQPLNVARVPNRSHGNPVVNLENLLARPAESQEKDSVGIADRGNGTAGGKLGLDVFAPVRDRLDPAIRLFDHATDSLKMLWILSSASVVIPCFDTVLITGNIF